MKKVILDQSKCVGCGACIAKAPNTFDYDEEGLSIVKNEEVTDEVLEEVMDACEGCPFCAIEVTEE